MSIVNIKEAMKPKQSLEVKEEKDSLSLVIKLNFSNEREKAIADNFLAIKANTNPVMSNNQLGIELLEAAIEQLAKETQ
jgi:hypothetical protein